MSHAISEFLPMTIRLRLVGLAAKAGLTAQEAERGRDSVAYRAVIREIDAVREMARSMCPELFRHTSKHPMDCAVE